MRTRTDERALTPDGLSDRFPHDIPGLLAFQAERDPDRLLIECAPVRLTYGGMQARARTLAAGLQSLGVERGDRIAIICPNRIEIFELYFGGAAAGLTQVPLNAYLKGEFLRYQIADSAAAVLVADAEGWAQVEPLLDSLPDLREIILLDDVAVTAGLRVRVHRYEDVRDSSAEYSPVTVEARDLMSILYTSGTTGLPKGCMLTHGYYLRVGAMMVDLMGQRPEDVLFTHLPAFHAVARMMVLAAALVMGSSAVIEPSFSASRFLARAAEVGATLAYGVGTTGTALLATPPSPADRAHSIRCFMVGPFNAEQQAQAQERFGFDAWTEIYGQTECVGITREPANGQRNRDSIGRAGIDLEVEILDDEGYPLPAGEVGEMALRPRHPYAMFSGYWGKPEATVEAYQGLWYRSGDYGIRDEAGYFRFVDRKKDAIRRRGENISSFEIETAIAKHPLVEDIAIHGVPCGSLEDDVKAVIVSSRHDELSPAEWFRYFAEELPYFAVPRYLEFVDELPRNAVGRLMKFKLRENPIHDGVWDFERLGLTIAASARR